VSRRGKLTAIFAALVLALLSGCASSVVPHDEDLADGLAGLQSSTGWFFDQLQQVTGTPDADWVHHAAWYEETRSEIAALPVRASATGATNDPTLLALVLLDQSVAELETAHAAGLSAAEIPVLRTLFDSQLRMLIQLETARQRTPVAEVKP
jgi:hypothetical protein